MLGIGAKATGKTVMQQRSELLREKLKDEARDRATLAELLGNRRSSPFISATEMDSRLSKIIAKKRRLRAVRC
jgi:antitoxin ParD1/3/4